MKTKNRKTKLSLLIVVLILFQFTLLVFIMPVSAKQNEADSEKIDERGADYNIYINPSSISIDRGQAYQLTASPLVSGNVSWLSNNTSIATVTQYGLVVGVSAGSTYINVAVDSAAPGINVARCLVTVSPDGIVADGVYFIRSAQSLSVDKYIDVEGPSSSNGAKMQLWELTGDTQRKWTMTLSSDGYYRVRSNYSSKYMRVTGSSATAGATITQNSSIVSGSKWALMQTAAGNYAFVPASSTSSLIVLNSPGTTNGYDLNTAAYTANTNYKDEWVPIRMLPLSGSEITYGVDDWSYFGYLNLYNNCYAYAINNQIDPEAGVFWCSQQPGSYAYRYGTGYTENFSMTGSAVSLAASNDFYVYNNIHTDTTYSITPLSDKYATCPAGSYKVALCIDLYNDYHWYRQDADGLWSHKLADLSVSRTDASGKMIIDPEEANRDYPQNGVNYSIFYGYYAVTPWNNMRTDLPDYSKHGLNNLSQDNGLAMQNVSVSIEEFNTIQSGMTQDEVINLLGGSGKIVGSGTLIYKYKMEDHKNAFVYFSLSGGNFLVTHTSLVEEELS